MIKINEKYVYIACGIISFLSIVVIIVAGTYPNIGV